MHKHTMKRHTYNYVLLTANKLDKNELAFENNVVDDRRAGDQVEFQEHALWSLPTLSSLANLIQVQLWKG